MERPVKTTRTYDGSRRRELARHNRTVMVRSATALFLERGFAATTIADVARASGASVQNVYKVFRNKVGLAKAVFDLAIAGDDEEVPMVERPSLLRVRDEPDPRRKLTYYGEHLALVAPRHVPFQLVILDAAASDPDAASVWEQLQDERLRGMSMFAADLDARGHLRADVTASDARDVLWTYNSAELYRLLVIERGWSPERYGSWVAQALIAALLP
ncbi:TetR/AcrR family transcriptional regulator [Ornithinimicrobium cavernae]|uniref:TetR/AcrR family transcriptional regulator n=1 Tax=Ornithinimicrobium cavernae TaxID=2666047 RepID=UPI000D6867D1|nr:TetR/AcrR family transcriptional regulator [Ornithinimicrobium cavernae]